MGTLNRRARLAPLLRLANRALVGAALAISAHASPGARAHSPDDPEAAWYNSLTTEQGTSCCSRLKDCDTASEYKAGDLPGSYWAMWHGSWVYVPPYAVLQRQDNPTGFAVLCATHINGEPIARCFVRPTEG